MITPNSLKAYKIELAVVVISLIAGMYLVGVFWGLVGVMLSLLLSLALRRLFSVNTDTEERHEELDFDTIRYSEVKDEVGRAIFGREG